MIKHQIISTIKITWGGPRGVMVKAMDCGIVVSEFEFQLHYYVHFETNTLGKGMNPSYPTNYGLNSNTAVLLENWIWHQITYKGWYAIKERNQNQKITLNTLTKT